MFGRPEPGVGSTCGGESSPLKESDGDLDWDAGARELDLHPRNVIVGDGEVVLLDWSSVGQGTVGEDRRRSSPRRSSTGTCRRIASRTSAGR